MSYADPSPYFTFRELTHSESAIRHGIKNEPNDEQYANMCFTTKKLVNLRNKVGFPLHITSAFRSAEVNKLVGGSPTSKHLEGLAVDIQIAGLAPIDVCRLILASGIEFDQLIYEGGWAHLGFTHGTPRNEVLTAVFRKGQKTTYLKGIQNV